VKRDMGWTDLNLKRHTANPSSGSVSYRFLQPSFILLESKRQQSPSRWRVYETGDQGLDL
jgi:hypothetical protein